MKKILAGLFALLLWTSFAAAQDKTQQAEQDWFTYYYLEKDSSRVPDFLAELQKSKRLDTHPETVPSIEGFLSVVFADNPGNADNWAHGVNYTGKLKTVIAYGLKPPSAPAALPIKTTADIDRTWGAFFASGDQTYLKKIESLLDNTKTDKKSAALHAAAAYSLGFNMTQHESVNRFMESESASRTGATGDELKQIVAGVEKQRADRAFPTHDGDFSALMFVTDPKLTASAANDVLHFKQVSHAKVGDSRALVIVFAGMQLSPDYMADVTYSVQITDPEGKAFTDQKDLEAIKRKLPTRFRVFNNKAVVFLNFDGKDTPGDYKISAVLSDNIAKKTLTLTSKVTLDK